MARRLLLKEDQLTSTDNPPVGYQWVGYNGLTFSERQSDGDIVPIGGSNTNTNEWTYDLGQYVSDEGGVIFHRYKDGVNENYLVVAITNQSTGQVWSNVTSTLIGSTAQSTWNGLENSLTITGQTGHTESAAQLCLEYGEGCDTISVTYTLEGEEPVTVVVGISNFEPIVNGKNRYDFNVVEGINGALVWSLELSVGASWFYSDGDNLAILTEDTPCPFGVYTIEPGSIFEAFSVAPVNPIDDWYLPAIDELSLLWQNRFNVNRTLSGYSSFGSISGATQIGSDFNAGYWSSTEYDSNNAWNFNFLYGTTNNDPSKDEAWYVRAVRKFSI